MIYIPTTRIFGHESILNLSITHTFNETFHSTSTFWNMKVCKHEAALSLISIPTFETERVPNSFFPSFFSAIPKSGQVGTRVDASTLPKTWILAPYQESPRPCYWGRNRGTSHFKG
ncbi:hypothetical protein CDAR_55111 [Caerostris darwini]|uniref:Uncharacterized protein n=1 Tax=Caerostris darwini TaxID=1538125 RepID=A0AAV4PHD7_9ARAC|nr:hypothetical protein CDAR_55111 [Caerostris darwini]